MPGAADDVSVAAAAKMLGYSRGQTYHYINEGSLPSFEDSAGRTRVARTAIRAFLKNPPKGARPGRGRLTESTADLAALTRRVELLEQADRDATALASRIADLEQAAARPERQEVDLWRRRANSARDAIATVAGVGDMYESAFDLLRQANTLDRQAQQKRDDADAAMAEARKAWRGAVAAFATPDDPDDLGAVIPAEPDGAT